MRIHRQICIILSLLFLGGCSSAKNVAVDFAPKETEKLVIYTPHAQEIHLPLIQEFEARTGIWVDIVYGGTNELLERIESEQKKPVADVLFGGGVEHMESYKDFFEPYLCTDSGKLRGDFPTEDQLWTPFSAIPVVLVYNTKLVSPTQLTSWEDLKDPVFRGKIAFADPSVSGSYCTALINRLLIDGGDRKQMLTEYAQDLQFHQYNGSGDALEAVVNGTCFVGITLESTAVKLIASGADIALVYPSDGTSFIFDGTAILKNAPHSENARRFLDFTVSYDVQKFLGEKYYRRPVRTDIPAEDSLLPLNQISLVDYDIRWAAQNREEILAIWSELFREGGSRK